VSRFLEPDKALAAIGEELEFTESRPLGATWVLDTLEAWLDIGPAMQRLLQGRRLDDSAERVLLAWSPNQALAPSSKLAAAPLAKRGRADRPAVLRHHVHLLPGR
jgi:hypothetical protein